MVALLPFADYPFKQIVTSTLYIWSIQFFGLFQQNMTEKFTVEYQ